MKKRLLSLFLAMAMILSCLSAMTFASAADPEDTSTVAAQAEDEAAPEEETGDTDVSDEDASVDDGGESAEEPAEEEPAEEPVEEESEAEDPEDEDEDDDEYVYVLMNIPYEDFYEDGVDAEVDAVSAATSSKSAFYNLAGGGYTGAEEGTIDGVTYYVLLSGAEYLELEELGYETVDADDAETISWTKRGTSMSEDLSGAQCLFTKGDYAYYVLTDEDDTPEYYLTAEVDGDGISITGFSGKVDTSYTATAELTTDGRHTDYEIEITTDLSDVIGTDPATYGENAISAVTVNTEDGDSYGLLHVVHIWTGFEIGWNYDELEELQGQTITSVTYYTTGGVYEVELEEGIYVPSEPVYVLMNVPYSDFYSVLNDDGVDTVTSATLNKTRTGSLAGGSYHVNSDGSDITGIIYYVRISEAYLEELELNEITDDSSVTISVTNRGTTTETTYTASEALFEAESYSYYMLDADAVDYEAPAYYLEAEIIDGELSFTELVGEVTTISDVEYDDFTDDTTYGDYELDFDSDELSEILNGATVSAVTVNTSDGSVYGLRHIENIWRDYKLAWSIGYTTTVHGCTVSYENYADMEGRTITSVTYYTTEGIYQLNLAEAITLDAYTEYLLMNVPYEDFYGAVDADVDAVSAATSSKSAFYNLAGGGYTGAEEGTIDGVTYYVAISKADYAELAELDYETVNDSDEETIEWTRKGTAMSATLTGSECLFTKGDYAYYVLTDEDDTPDYYLTAEIEDGEISFTGFTGSADTSYSATAELTLDGRHTDYEIEITTDLSDVIGTDPATYGENAISAVTVNTEEGNSYGLLHVVHIWTGFEIGWNYDELEELQGQTITSVTYYTTDGVYEVTLEEALYIPGESVYLLMNVPYEDFYGAVDAEVDTISAATSSKSAFYNLAGGGYTGEEESTVDGVTYYVLLSGAEYLELEELGYETVNADDTETISWTKRGTLMTEDLSGLECLFTKGDYAYYVLTGEDETPEYYLTAAITDGVISFTDFTGSADTSYSAEAELTTGGRHTDYEIEITTGLSDVIGTDPASLGAENAISAVTVNTEEGNSYGLLHVVHIWTGFEIGWNYDEFEELQGQTITSVTYYTTGGVYEVALSESLYIPEYIDDLSAALDSSETTITLSGIPTDAENVAVTVSYTDTDGETVELTASYNSSTGALTLSEDLSAETTYTISVTADNYIFEDVTVTTSVWYTISFEANRGKGSMDDLTVVAGSSVTLTKNSFTRSGNWYFDGWNTRSNGRGTSYKNQATITPTSDLTLYAQWEYYEEDYDDDDDDDDDNDNEDEEEEEEVEEEDVTEETTEETADETESEAEESVTFVDVANDTYYADAVEWAVSEGIVNGTSETTFSPDDELTRAQLVTLLYRLAGSPDITGLDSPFEDINDSSVSVYYKAIIWAYNNGIAKGTSSTTFSPFQAVTRAEAVTFLYRYYDEPTADALASLLFEDVADTAYYADAAVWAVNEGITTGTTSTIFSPDQYATRAQFVTFLYRAEN